MEKRGRKLQYTYATGKRKEAAARVRLFKGKGENLVNQKPISQYFPGGVMKAIWLRPFEITQTFEKYYVTAKIVGGGKRAQLTAFVHGLARAFAALKPEEFRTSLKKAGLLTRDSRIRERRKIGTGGKARRLKQSPKR